MMAREKTNWDAQIALEFDLENADEDVAREIPEGWQCWCGPICQDDEV